MSVREDQIKANTISFSDQITSRLHRWVQRTTSKVRNDKERSQSVRIEHRDNEKVNRDGIDIKECITRENFATKSRQSRSYEELEKALNDLIHNCVSSSSVIDEFSNPACAAVHDNANINIARENNNNTEFALTHKTNNDTGIETKKRFSDGKDNACSSGGDSKRENANKSSGTVFGSLPHCEGKQTDVGDDLTSGVKNVSLGMDENDEFGVGFITSGGNERKIEHERNFDKEFHQSTISAEISGLNTSLSNVNKGLNTGSDIDRSCLEASCVRVRENPRKQNEKPPLRRIQSEGDALELRLSFQDSDVTEFAATCIQHAQKKRFSDITPMLSKRDFLNETIEDRSDYGCIKSEEDILAPNLKESSNVFERIPEIQLDETDDKNTRQTEHIPLTDRPSSLSFPLDARKRVKNSKNSSSLKNKVSPSSSPRSTTNPKFRRFPCQPVFYVPTPTDSRTVPKNTRKGSVGEQPKVEYLI